MDENTEFQSFKVSFRAVLVLLLGIGMAGLFFHQMDIMKIKSAAAAHVRSASTLQVRQGGMDKQYPEHAPDPAWLALARSLDQATGESPAGMTLNVNLTDAHIVGRVPLPNMASVSVERDGNQVAIGQVMPVPDNSGYVYTAYPQWDYPLCQRGYCFVDQLMPGDIIQVSQLSSAISLTLPELTALANSDTDLVYGISSPGISPTVYVFSADLPGAVFTQTIASGLDGVYQADFSSLVDLKPADRGYVVDEIGPERRAYRPFVAPQLIVEIGGTTLQVIAAPYVEGTITVTDSAGQVLWTGGIYVDWTGKSITTYQPDPFNQNQLQAEQGVLAQIGGQFISTKVQPLSVSADLDQGLVQGQALPGQSVRIQVISGPITENTYWNDPVREQVVVTTTTEGEFSANLPLQPADYGFAFVTSPKGHQTIARFAIPALQLVMGWRWEGITWQPVLSGQVNAFGEDIEISVLGPSGYFKDRHRFSSFPNGYILIYDADYGLVLESGDVINLVTLSGDPLASLTLPLLTAEGDAQNDIVSGIAPPGTRLAVVARSDFPNVSSPFGVEAPVPYPTRIVTATAQGTYLADFSGLADLTPQSWGTVSMVTPEGHLLSRLYKIPVPCPGIIESLQVGSNHLVLSTCRNFRLVLMTRDGRLKFDREFSESEFLGIDFTLWDQDNQPVLLQPGDRISLTSFGASLQVEVPRLDLQLTPGTNQLSGHAPADEVVKIHFWDNHLNEVITTTTSHQGSFLVDMPGITQFDPGSHARIAFTLGDTEAYVFGSLKGFDVTLYEEGLKGWLAPFEVYTLTLTEAAGGDQQVYTNTASSDGFFYIYRGYLDYPHNLLQPGDVLRMVTPQTRFDLSLPALTAQVERASARISGRAPPGAKLLVELTNIYHLPSQQEVSASAMGFYSADFPEYAGSEGLRGGVTLLDPSGSQVGLAFGLQSWQITLGERCLGGFAGAIGLPASLTRQSASGALPEVVSVPGFPGNEGFYACLSAPLSPQDALTLTGPLGSMQFTVPLLSAHYDGIRKVVEGLAPPGEGLFVTLNADYHPYVRQTQAGSDGRYGMDLSDLFFRTINLGEIHFTDADGNYVGVNFLQAIYTFLPLMVLSSP